MSRVFGVSCYSSCQRVCVKGQPQDTTFRVPLSPRFWKEPYWNLPRVPGSSKIPLVFSLLLPSTDPNPKSPGFGRSYHIQPTLVSVSSPATLPKSNRYWYDGVAWGQPRCLPSSRAPGKSPKAMPNEPVACHWRIPILPEFAGQFNRAYPGALSLGAPSKLCRHGYPNPACSLIPPPDFTPKGPQDESRTARRVVSRHLDFAASLAVCPP